jgi:hypothetical protein
MAMYYYSQKFFHPCSASVNFSHRVPYKKSDNFYNKVCYGSDSRLSHAQVQMARELGMNLRKLGSLDNHKQERWKAPLPVFIEQCYRRRFGKVQPDRVISVEDRAREIAAKKVEKRERRQGAETLGAQELDQSKRE